MIGRDVYIKMLEKRASDFDGGKTGRTYDHDVDSAAVANSEVKKNLSDNRATLGTLFSGFDKAQKKETEFAGKWSPTSKPEESASPLIKVAMDALCQSERFRDYPLHCKAAAIRGFADELEKIAEKQQQHKAWEGSSHDLRPYLKKDEVKAISDNDFHGPEALHFQQPGPLKAGLGGLIGGGLLGAIPGGVAGGGKGALIGAGIGGGVLGGLAALGNRKAHGAKHLRSIAKDTAYDAKSDNLSREQNKLDAHYGYHGLSEKVAVSAGWIQNATRMGVAKAPASRALQFAGRVGSSGSAKGLMARGAALADPMVQRSIGMMERANPGSVAMAMGR